MKEHFYDESSFIGAWYIPEDVCDDLVKVYNENKDRRIQGKVGNQRVDDKVKKSTELILNKDNPDVSRYKEHLQNALNMYKRKYPFADAVVKYFLFGNIKIQHYKPGEGFYKWHAEREGNSIITNGRHLVFMTYLNTVKDAGTEFYHQKITTPCIKGLTVIWPSDWTHKHRGVINNENEKYIITGWYNFKINYKEEVEALKTYNPQLVKELKEILND